LSPRRPCVFLKFSANLCVGFVMGFSFFFLEPNGSAPPEAAASVKNPMFLSHKPAFILRFFSAALLLPIGAEAGVLAHYSFDTDYKDSSPNQRHGSFVDTETVGNSGITKASGGHKVGGGALDLSGDRDYITVPPVTFASGRSYTIAFWARKEAGDTADRAMWDMVIGQLASTNFFIALGDSTGETGLRWRGAGTGSDRQADFTVPRDNNWHHYALVASGTTVTLYLDGQIFGTATGKLTGFTYDTIGDGYPSTRRFGFHGQIDEMWVFDEALDVAAVGKIYQSNDAGAPPSTATRLRVCLLGGQSNADGRAVPTELPSALQIPQPDVDLYYKVEGSTGTLTTLRPGLSETSQFGPEVMLGNRLAKLHANEPGTRIAIIKYANGGTNLHTEWKAGGDATTNGDGPEYLVFQQTVRDGLAALAAAHPQAEITLEGMAWMQGETDATAAQAAAYQANLTTFISDVRATFAPRLPFIIGRLSNNQTDIAATYRDTIRAGQTAVAATDPLASIIDTDGLPMKSDNLHFNGTAQQAMGVSFAGQMAYQNWVVETFTAADIAAGKAEPGNDSDGDGHSNYEEYLNGTDPSSGASLYQVSFTLTGPGVGSISYPTSRSRTYLVEKYGDDRTWKPALPAEQGTGATVQRHLDISRDKELYRVRVGLP